MDAKEKRRQRLLNTLKKYSLTKARNLVATEFQLMIRLEAIEPDGKLTCVTCGKRSEFGFDAGHYMGRTRSNTLFDEMNCHPQCKSCNNHQSGALGKYRKYLVKRYGEAAVENLEARGAQTKQWTREELVDLKIEYLRRQKAAKERLGL